MLQLKVVQCTLHHVMFYTSGLEDGFSSCRMGFLKCLICSGVVFQQNSSDCVYVMLVRGKKNPIFFCPRRLLPE